MIVKLRLDSSSLSIADVLRETDFIHLLNRNRIIDYHLISAFMSSAAGVKLSNF